MTHDPEAAERAAQVMDAMSDSLRRGASRAIEAAALIRAQAAEIAAHPAPQPDADDREAMATIAWNVLVDWFSETSKPAYAIADALLAAGWTRKREEG